MQPKDMVTLRVVRIADDIVDLEPADLALWIVYPGRHLAFTPRGVGH